MSRSCVRCRFIAPALALTLALALASGQLSPELTSMKSSTVSMAPYHSTTADSNSSEFKPVTENHFIQAPNTCPVSENLATIFTPQSFDWATYWWPNNEAEPTKRRQPKPSAKFKDLCSYIFAAIILFLAILMVRTDAKKITAYFHGWTPGMGKSTLSNKLTTCSILPDNFNITVHSSDEFVKRTNKKSYMFWNDPSTQFESSNDIQLRIMEKFLAGNQMHRVLDNKPDGRSVVLVPGYAHYPILIALALVRISQRVGHPCLNGDNPDSLRVVMMFSKFECLCKEELKDRFDHVIELRIIREMSEADNVTIKPFIDAIEEVRLTLEGPKFQITDNQHEILKNFARSPAIVAVINRIQLPANEIATTVATQLVPILRN